MTLFSGSLMSAIEASMGARGDVRTRNSTILEQKTARWGKRANALALQAVAKQGGHEVRR